MRGEINSWRSFSFKTRNSPVKPRIPNYCSFVDHDCSDFLSRHAALSDSQIRASENNEKQGWGQANDLFVIVNSSD
jgi:hypothetical protein